MKPPRKDFPTLDRPIPAIRNRRVHIPCKHDAIIRRDYLQVTYQRRQPCFSAADTFTFASAAVTSTLLFSKLAFAANTCDSRVFTTVREASSADRLDVNCRCVSSRFCWVTTVSLTRLVSA